MFGLFIYKARRMTLEQKQLLHFIEQVYPMDSNIANEIVQHFSIKHFQANTVLLKEGKLCNDYYFICEGYGRSYILDDEGNNITISFYTPNSLMFDLSSFFKRIPSSENIETLTNCTVLCLHFEELQKLFHSIPQFREFGRLVLVNHYTILKQQMLQNLKLSAEDKYKKLIETTPEIFQHLSLKQIASFIGITDTSLSRIRKEISKH